MAKDKNKQPTATPTVAELQAEIARLKAEKAKSISIKVGNKGGVSVSGLQRFPTTLYADQWKLLLDKKEDILKFIEDHESELAHK